MLIITRFLFLSACLVSISQAHGSCKDLLKIEIHIYEPTMFISTPESIPIVEVMNRKLSELLVDAKSGDKLKSKIYAPLIPHMEETLSKALSLEQSRAPDQNAIFFRGFVVRPDAGVDFGHGEHSPV